MYVNSRCLILPQHEDTESNNNDDMRTMAIMPTLTVVIHTCCINRIEFVLPWLLLGCDDINRCGRRIASPEHSQLTENKYLCEGQRRSL